VRRVEEFHDGAGDQRALAVEVELRELEVRVVVVDLAGAVEALALRDGEVVEQVLGELGDGLEDGVELLVHVKLVVHGDVGEEKQLLVLVVELELRLAGVVEGGLGAARERGVDPLVHHAWIQHVAKHTNGPYAASSGDMTSCGPPGRAQGCAPSPRRPTQRCADDNAPWGHEYTAKHISN
jgi:hypothetical protein